MIDGTFRQQLKTALDRDRRRWRVWRRRVVAAASAVLLVLAMGFVWQYRHSCDSTAGLFRTGLTGRCFGITDGSHVFAEDLRGIERLIREENRAVEKSSQYVTIAFYTPMVPEPGDTTSPASVVHDLEGAYLAQWRANHETAALPHIRLALADPGHRAEYWQQVAHGLEKMANGKDRLVAVAGLGNSTEETRRLIEELSRNNIPMVGSVITSTELNGTKFRGVARVAPDNRDEAQAAVNSLSQTDRVALLVQDMSNTDNYVKTLGEEFHRQFVQRSGRPHLDTETYHSELPNAAGRFTRIVGDICTKRSRTVYFAGRGISLGDFVRALGDRTCTDFPVSVMTGDDATQIGPDADGRISAALGKGVSVKYTALAHPDMWRNEPTSREAQNYAAFRRACDKADLGGLLTRSTFDDGQFIMAHDALLVAVQAIRASVGQGSVVPSTGDVLQNLIGGLQMVPGASGFIDIEQNTGNPRNKPVPIVQLRADDTTAFVELAWPDGGPPAVPR